MKTNILDNGWIRVGLLSCVLAMAWRLTDWGMRFAVTALTAKVTDWLGIPATIGAVGTIPIALLGILFTKYMELRSLK